MKIKECLVAIPVFIGVIIVIIGMILWGIGILAKKLTLKTMTTVDTMDEWAKK